MSYLYINRGDGTFEDASLTSGFALNEDGREVAAMGVAVGDYLNNGMVDFAISDFSDEAKLLFHNDGGGNFTEMSMRSGIGKISIPFLGWGDGFLDYDNDGWLDLMFINGHIYPIADKEDWGTSYAQRPLLFHNMRDGKFEEVPPVRGSGLAQAMAGRGAAFGDFFNDGKIDVIINPDDGPPVLLRNVDPDHHHWVELKLVGGAKGPRDAVGATVYLTANGMRQRQDVISGGSYVSTNDPRPHFGLGDATDAGAAEIHWPSGAKETVKLPAVDRIFTITEGKGITGALCGGSACVAGAAAGSKTMRARVPLAFVSLIWALCLGLCFDPREPDANHCAWRDTAGRFDAKAWDSRAICRCHGKGWRAFSACGASYFAQISARDHGLRRGAVRLR